MKYFLLLKSGSDAPDVEREVETRTKEEALDIFCEWLEPYGWERNVIEKGIIEEEDFLT